MKKITILFFALVLLTSCGLMTKESADESIQLDTHQGTSLLGKELTIRQIDPKTDSGLIARYQIANYQYKLNPNNVDAIIWLGRRMAYMGDYKKAIEIFSEGIDKFPNEAQMYRHRGHRYISLRQFDKAIADLEKAVQLIEGEEDIIEADGIPNIRNTPVSSLHINIWYHLGLAHYLKNDLKKALWGFNMCLKASNNPDMLVANTNWIYMILKRMNRDEEAEEILKSIHADLDVFENMVYHQLCLFYKGLITEEELLINNQSGDYINNALMYGLSNWYFYNGNTDKARELFSTLIDKGAWAGFGTISAEADLFRMIN